MGVPEKEGTMTDITSLKIEHQVIDSAPEVPTINLAELDGPDRALTMAKIAGACETYGFFQIVNHGIDLALIQRLRNVYKEFFTLTEDEKMEYYVDDKPGTQGYRKLTHTNANGPTHTTEYLFYIFSPMSKRLIDQWPDIPENFRSVYEEYMTAVRALGEKLLAVISEILGVPGQTLQNIFNASGEPAITLRANYYHPWKTEKPDMGIGAHSDPGGITLLLQDEEAGLQVKVNDRWVDIQPNLDAYVINIGDQMEILSNGRFKSLEHRGLASEKRNRMSFPVFYNPNYESTVAPLKEMVDESNPPRYSSVTFYDYFVSFLDNGIGGGKGKLEQFRIVQP